MTKVFVSGCYDILHGGHIQFFRDARALGDHLTVCFASDAVYRAWKRREPALPQDSRRAILEELRCVDAVVMSESMGGTPAFDFTDEFQMAGADILASTLDDGFAEQKAAWCLSIGARFVQIYKHSPYAAISTTQIRERIATR